jgi:hypothetical protein
MIGHVGDVAYLEGIRDVSSRRGACIGIARIRGCRTACAAGGTGKLSRDLDLMAYLAAQIVNAPSQFVHSAGAVVRESVVPTHSAETAAHSAARLIVRRRARGLTRGL